VSVRLTVKAKLLGPAAGRAATQTGQFEILAEPILGSLRLTAQRRIWSVSPGAGKFAAVRSPPRTGYEISYSLLNRTGC
jgi:hypothetical protein